MTNINCISDCKHQKDGKCCLDTAEGVGQIGGECVYYSKKNQNSLDKTSD